MGCDIHFYVEKKENGKWVSADTWTKEEGEKRKSVNYDKRFYTSRNYDLFAILADVRNGRGVAGCDTGDGFVPISAPKGLPKDVCTEIKTESKGWGSDGHSHSYFTWAELFAYDWTRTTKKRGLVSASEYFDWTQGGAKERGEEPDYCGMVGGQFVQVVSKKEMDKKIKALSTLHEKTWKKLEASVEQNLRDVYCQVEWKISYFTAAERFWSNTIPRLLRLGKPEDVRIVFWFDN
jgi:hypothetical protein